VTLNVTLVPGLEAQLLAERALFWPAEATLFVADLHVGKPDVFHGAGIPIPAAVTHADLDRLSRLIGSTGARRLVILGDFFHAAASQSPGVFAALESWRARHPALVIQLVAGNHDRHAGPPPAALAIEACGDEVRIGPFVCVHEPQTTPAVPYVLCGHLHPIALLTEPRAGGRTLRLPCFHVGAAQTILPAFGAFTGGKTIAPVRGDRVFVIAGGQVLQATT
jgi:DNA ligase-associated metallophosphoesterase